MKGGAVFWHVQKRENENTQGPLRKQGTYAFVPLLTRRTL